MSNVDRSLSSRNLALVYIPAVYVPVGGGLAYAIGFAPRQVAAVTLALLLVLLGGGLFDLLRAGIFEQDDQQPARNHRLLCAEALVFALPPIFCLVLFLCSVICGFDATPELFAGAVGAGLFAGRATIEQMFIRRGTGNEDDILIFRRRHWD